MPSVHFVVVVKSSKDSRRVSRTSSAGVWNRREGEGGERSWWGGKGEGVMAKPLWTKAGSRPGVWGRGITRRSWTTDQTKQPGPSVQYWLRW